MANHFKIIVDWMRAYSTPKEAKEFFSKFTDPFGDKFFTFDKKKDDILKLCGGENEDYKTLLEEILGKEEMTRDERQIFKTFHDEDGDTLQLSDDLLEQYEKTHKRQYLAEANILTVYEAYSWSDGTSTAVDNIYVIDFDKCVVHHLLYEQERDGDIQRIILEDSRKFVNK